MKNKKVRSGSSATDYCFTCIHSQIHSRSSIKQRIVLKSGKPFVQRPDGRRSRHVQQSPLGIEQTRRAISKQSLVPNLLFMNKVIVENRNQDDICDKQDPYLFFYMIENSMNMNNQSVTLADAKVRRK